MVFKIGDVITIYPYAWRSAQTVHPTYFSEANTMDGMRGEQ